MASSEFPGHDSDIGQAVRDVAFMWDSRMDEYMLEGRPIVALRGAGSVNGIEPDAANRVVDEVLVPQIGQGTIFVFDGDPVGKVPDIGYIASGLRDADATVLAVQTDDWYYPPKPGSNLTSASGKPYGTYVITRGLYPGDHNRLTQSERLAAYPQYSQLYIGALGLIASGQMVDYCHKVPEGSPVNVTIIKAENNRSLSAEIGRRLAEAVTKADEEKFRGMLEQRRQKYGKLWNNDGKFNEQLWQEIRRQEDTHELAILWDMDSRVEKVDILNCRKIDLFSPEYNRAFAEAQYFTKTRPVRARQIPEGTSERIEVKSGATGDTANGGDWVCRKQKPDGSFGEEYVVYGADFVGLYDPSLDTSGEFTPKWDPRKLIQVHENVIFMTPWGEKQAVRRNGYLMERTKPDGTVERYGIAQSDVEGDFESVS